MGQHPVPLFTGQWADMPLDPLAEKAASWGYDGLELACWGDHFDVAEAVNDDGPPPSVSTRSFADLLKLHHALTHPLHERTR